MKNSNSSECKETIEVLTQKVNAAVSMETLCEIFDEELFRQDSNAHVQMAISRLRMACRRNLGK